MIYDIYHISYIQREIDHNDDNSNGVSMIRIITIIIMFRIIIIITILIIIFCFFHYNFYFSTFLGFLSCSQNADNRTDYRTQDSCPGGSIAHFALYVTMKTYRTGQDADRTQEYSSIGRMSCITAPTVYHICNANLLFSKCMMRILQLVHVVCIDVSVHPIPFQIEWSGGHIISFPLKDNGGISMLISLSSWDTTADGYVDVPFPCR